MSNYSRKFKQPLSFSLYFLLSAGAMMFLVGCSGSDDIPPASILTSGRVTLTWEDIPGDTTASALSRLDSDVLSMTPDIVLMTLGGNDLKNGVSKDIAFNNLKRIVQSIQQQGAKVIIGGLRLPGMDRGFGKGYEDLARQTGAMLIPDLYAGILDDPKLMSDPIHPNNSGYRIIAQRFNQALASVGVTAMPHADPTAATAHPVTLAWDEVPNATSYNIYWSDMPGVTKKNGTKIADVKNPHKITGLKKGNIYYFVVTAVNASGESKESEELSLTVGQ
jgi:hypothetical protein